MLSQTSCVCSVVILADREETIFVGFFGDVYEHHHRPTQTNDASISSIISTSHSNNKDDNEQDNQDNKATSSIVRYPSTLHRKPFQTTSTTTATMMRRTICIVTLLLVLASVAQAFVASPLATKASTVAANVPVTQLQERRWNFNDGQSPWGLKKNAEIWNGRVAQVSFNQSINQYVNAGSHRRYSGLSSPCCWGCGDCCIMLSSRYCASHTAPFRDPH